MKYLLKSMQMARSTYYFELSKADQVAVRNHCLADEIKDIFSQHKGRYGVRRVYQELIKRGHKVNHKRIQRLMHTMGLAGKRPKEKYHSYKGEVGKVAENILDRDFSTTAPMQKWTTDVSQFGFSWGKCALPGFVDSKNEEKTERNAGYLVVSHSGGGMLRQGTRKGIRRTPANRGMRAHWVVKGLDISEDVCHGLCP